MTLLTSFIDFCNKNSGFIGIAIGVLVSILILLWFSKNWDISEKLFKRIDSAVDIKMAFYKKDIESIKDLLTKLEIRHPVNELIAKNISMFESIFKHLNDGTDILFAKMQHSIIQMQESFIINYLNGSQPEKAREILIQGENKIIEVLSCLNIEDKKKFMASMEIFLKIISQIGKKLIFSLEKETSKAIKKNIISSEFSTMLNMVLYFRLKYPMYMELTDQEIVTELENRYNSTRVNFECFDQSISLAGW